MQGGHYKPIAAYAAIGNLRTVALVGRDGSIDWCCFPYLDRPSVFGAILDYRRGGRFAVTVPEAGLGEQRYVQDTNVLKTEFPGERGSLAVTDLMPLAGDLTGRGGSHAPPEIHRILRCTRGTTEVRVEWSPRLDYGRSPTGIERIPGGWLATDGRDEMVLFGLAGGTVADEGDGQVLRARVTMQEGDRRVLVTRWGTEDMTFDPGGVTAAEEETIATWRQWAHRDGTTHAPAWAGDWFPMLLRSELALKMLTNAATGAIAAAPTTSLPEEIGGVRNWDYRYAWIRDSAMTAQALIALGHETEAVELLSWMERVSEMQAEQGPALQIMYGIHGRSDLGEEELDHLEGYCGSRPVRIGNGAATQLQLEIYGELLNTAYELQRRGFEMPEHQMAFLARVADEACALWHEPDHGIWEIRSEPRHFVYSKVMLWVALDRAIHMAEQCGFTGDVERWRRSRSEIKAQVLAHGYDTEVGAFVQSYGSKTLDAANLRIPLLEFLPFDDERVQSTIDRTIEGLVANGFVYRYLADDGLPGEEGAFGLCTFWLIDVLALSGRVDEARELFERMVGHANHVGLYAEQFDPVTGAFLGNFPQAFTHIGLINSAIYLAYAMGREVSEYAPIGTPEHRALMNRKQPRGGAAGGGGSRGTDAPAPLQ